LPHTYTCIYIHIYTYIQIHAYTYIYIQYRHILYDTYTYIHPEIGVGRGFSGAEAVACDSTVHYYLPRSSQMGVGAGLPSAKCVWTACGRGRGCALDPPDACYAPWCAKSGLGLGPRWREKVVGRLPRGALSGARQVPPRRGAFWWRCAGICARLGQYIQYIQILWTYTRE
jgi:hypothetical protein